MVKIRNNGIYCYFVVFYHACGALGFLSLILPAVERFMRASIFVRCSQLRICLTARDFAWFLWFLATTSRRSPRNHRKDLLHKPRVYE